MIHELKTLPKHFQQIKAGVKTYECRLNDRDYKEGDTLFLKEWDDGTTGEFILVKVTQILYDWQFKGVAKGYCIMSIKALK